MQKMLTLLIAFSMFVFVIIENKLFTITTFHHVTGKIIYIKFPSNAFKITLYHIRPINSLSILNPFTDLAYYITSNYSNIIP